MSTVEHPDPKHEIIIVRRHGGGDHDDHHGGVWKIAFADFMTAMMCFFLVMWLINAANEQTKAAVASYFNPIKLTDRNASRKGLEDVGEGPQQPDDSNEDISEPSTEATGAGAQRTGPSQRSEAVTSADDTKHTDEHLFSNPFAVLAEIASETGAMQNISEKGEGGAQTSGPATGASGGESFRDPFAPDFWSQQVAPTFESETARQQAGSAEEMTDGAASPDGTTDAAEAQQAARAAPEAPKEAVDKPQETAAEAAKPADKVAAPADASTKSEPAPKPAPPQTTEEAKREAAEIRQELQAAFGADSQIAEGMSVDATPEGVTISVTDQLDFGMFEIGSAVPKRDLVLAMEKIARIIMERQGRVTINGHTDARPFAGNTYDNWRLSTARAHSAYYMLVRGGLDERRFLEVAGFADRRLKDAADPFAASNRRIEILLQVGG